MPICMYIYIHIYIYIYIYKFIHMMERKKLYIYSDGEERRLLLLFVGAGISCIELNFLYWYICENIYHLCMHVYICVKYL